MRIHVTGNAGSGKSTLAQALGEKTGVPVFGLDKLVWKPGWGKTPFEERVALEKELIQKPEWIIDGVSSRVRGAAELVVFLDRARLTCLLRCFRRNVRYLFTSRPELPANCPELLIIPKLMRIIWNFPNLVGKKILEESERVSDQDRFVVIRNNKEINRLLQCFEVRYNKCIEAKICANFASR